ncbi:MAG: DUF692 family multinuclear iron-containing protein [Nannocystaceae bacterium]
MTKNLGVGINYQPAIESILDPNQGLVDFVELSPDLLCRETAAERGPSLTYHQGLLDGALRACASLPIVVHGLGLSIGTASGWNGSYLDILDQLERRRAFVWHSEHIGFLFARDDTGKVRHAGVQLPMPLTRSSLDLLVARVGEIRHRYAAPFLMENITHYLPELPAEDGLDEPEFLTELCQRSRCGLLLDLYNLHCNAQNFDFDTYASMSRMPLDRVVEVHLAGGSEHRGFLLDVHGDGVPEEVWAMYRWLLPRAPRLRGVVFEILEQAVPILGIAGISDQLRRARSYWKAGQQSPTRSPTHVVTR